MKHSISIVLLLGLTSCAEMIPGLTKAMDDYVTDEAVGVTVDKAAMQKDTDVEITVRVINKDVEVTAK